MKELYSALLAFQGKVGAVKRDRVNPHFKSRYATLEAVCDTIRPAMQECGLVWLQSPGELNESGLEVRTVIAHAASGQSFDYTMRIPLSKKDAQGAGSALTYAMRYSLMAVLGLPPTDDDDANEACKTLPKSASRDDYARLQDAMRSFDSAAALKGWWLSDATKKDVANLPSDWQKTIFDEFKETGIRLNSPKDEFPGDTKG